MVAEHGTRRRYLDEGCRCEDCRAANNAYQRDWRVRRLMGPVDEPASGPGRVEAGVTEEIDGLAAQARPGLAAAALALARVLDNPPAISSHASAAKVLATLLDKLRAASARGRRGGLAMVRTMTDKGGA
jgi:hypothetical protein